MKKLVLFLLVMGCILPVKAYTPWDFYRYQDYQYNRYSHFPSFWDHRNDFDFWVPKSSELFVERPGYYPQPYVPRSYSEPSYFSPYPYNVQYPQFRESQSPYPPRPFPILATGSVIEPDPGDSFPWQLYPDYNAQQYYDLDPNEVLIRAGSFLPSTTRVKVGDRVYWKNQDADRHILRALNGDAFNSGVLIPGGSFSKRFTMEGTYDYFDPLHPWMRGRVVVSN